MADAYNPMDRPKKRRGPGRPPGSKNRRPETLLTEDKVAAMVARARPYLSIEQQTYYDQVMRGEIEVDPIREMELLVVELRLMRSEAMAYMIDPDLGKGKVTQDMAKFLSEVRQTNKDLFEMKRKAEADKTAQAESDDAIDLTEDVDLELGRFLQRT